MTVTTTAVAAASAVGADSAFPSPAWESRTACFDTHWGRSGIVITAFGEVDAANAGSFGGCVGYYASHCEWLVLELSGVEFVSTAILPVLRAIGDRCAAITVHWALVPSRAVSKMIRFCDFDTALPVSESLTDALAQVQSQRLRLITR